MRVDLNRRFAGALLASLAVGPPPQPSLADDAAVLPPPAITSKARLAITIGSGEPRFMTIGLYGKAAPQSVALFRILCSGIPSGGSYTNQPDTLSYRGSSCTRIQPNKAIVLGHLPAGTGQTIERSIDSTGYVRSELVNLADNYKNDDVNGLSHDRAGLISMKLGGGEFEFVLTPAANPSLDASRIVVGEVLDGMDVVSELNAVPSRKPSNENEVGGLIYALGAYDETKYLGVAKAGGDPRARIEQVYRPLLKVKIVSAEVLS